MGNLKYFYRESDYRIEVYEYADELLDLLGNETRRRILQILANEPRYFIELAREVGVGQQALLKHLSLLERSGLITSYKAKGRGGPDRKYFKLNKDLYLTIDLTEEVVGIRLYDLSDVKGKPPIVLDELTEFERFYRSGDLGETVKMARSILLRIDKEIERFKMMTLGLMKLRQRVLSMVRELACKEIEDPMERRALFFVICSEKVSVERLAYELDIRESEARTILSKLGELF